MQCEIDRAVEDDEKPEDAEFGEGIKSRLSAFIALTDDEVESVADEVGIDRARAKDIHGWCVDMSNAKRGVGEILHLLSRTDANQDKAILDARIAKAESTLSGTEKDEFEKAKKTYDDAVAAGLDHPIETARAALNRVIPKLTAAEKKDVLSKVDNEEKQYKTDAELLHSKVLKDGINLSNFDSVASQVRFAVSYIRHSDDDTYAKVPDLLVLLMHADVNATKLSEVEKSLKKSKNADDIVKGGSLSDIDRVVSKVCNDKLSSFNEVMVEFTHLKLVATEGKMSAQREAAGDNTKLDAIEALVTLIENAEGLDPQQQLDMLDVVQSAFDEWCAANEIEPEVTNPEDNGNADGDDGDGVSDGIEDEDRQA